MALNPVMQFVEIECDCKQEVFCSDIFLASGQEFSERIILLGNSKYSLCLYGSVYPELYPFLRDYVLSACFSVIVKFLADLNTLGMDTLIALSIVRTPFTGFTTIDLCMAYISGRTFLVFGSLIR